MSDSWFSCKPCGASDPTQDTVKVNVSLLEATAGKENQAPQQIREEEERRREAEKKIQAEREAEERRKQAEAQAKREREAAIEAARKAEEEERLRREREQEERARREAEDAVAKAEEERMIREAEEASRIEHERQEEEKREGAIKVNAWCKENGYQDMNTAKKTFKGNTKFPLHTAVKHASVDIVELMVKLDINKDVKDSKGKTPLQLLEKMAKCDARDKLMAALQ